jgi:amino acid transporter
MDVWYCCGKCDDSDGSVFISFQMGQPRIWMSMSRDGLLPKRFSRSASKYKTPSYATIVTGFSVCSIIF